MRKELIHKIVGIALHECPDEHKVRYWASLAFSPPPVGSLEGVQAKMGLTDEEMEYFVQLTRSEARRLLETEVGDRITELEASLGDSHAVQNRLH